MADTQTDTKPDENEKITIDILKNECVLYPRTVKNILSIIKKQEEKLKKSKPELKFFFINNDEVIKWCLSERIFMQKLKKPEDEKHGVIL